MREAAPQACQQPGRREGSCVPGPCPKLLMVAVREAEITADLAWNLQHKQEEQQLDYELPWAPLQNSHSL